MASPEDMFDFDGDDKSHEPVTSELRPTPRPSGPSGWQLPFTLLRRELRWFYVQLHGRVPAVGEAPAPVVAAASRIAGWLSDVGPESRGAFVLRYDGRRWPVRLIRQFGGLTSVVVRCVAMRQPRGPTDTLAVAEQAAVAELLADIAAAGRPIDFTRSASAMDPARVIAFHSCDVGSGALGAAAAIAFFASARYSPMGVSIVVPSHCSISAGKDTSATYMAFADDLLMRPVAKSK